MGLSEFIAGQVAFFEGKPWDHKAPQHWRLGYIMEKNLTTQDGPRGDPRKRYEDALTEEPTSDES